MYLLIIFLYIIILKYKDTIRIQPKLTDTQM
jgi:hypothetical protein